MMTFGEQIIGCLLAIVLAAFAWFLILICIHMTAAMLQGGDMRLDEPATQPAEEAV